jgi:hypothetical protein
MGDGPIYECSIISSVFEVNGQYQIMTSQITFMLSSARLHYYNILCY